MKILNLVLTRTLHAFALTLSILLLTSCTGSNEPQNEFLNFGFLEGIYSTRPTTRDPAFFIIKLKNPALLETASRQNGILTIDKKLAQAIQDEQAATIASLQKISSDIKIIFRYRLVLNGLAIVAPENVLGKIQDLPNVIMSEKSSQFGRPFPLDAEIEETPRVGTNTSVKFIGAEAAHAQQLHGEGIRVGIIDTGIDYTHKMFLGEGTEDAYKKINPSEVSPAFPGKKVVGGLDLAGSAYDSSSAKFELRVPVPDANPLDESGHGTHVAGTVAGLGDGVNTYSGVAPAANLYALKVFGAKGSTSDEVVIAALEYAADPTGDLSFKEQLDVVNLSLGSDYGSPHTMYSHALKNLVGSGTVVVASAGNSGNINFVTGTPGVCDDAISVASSIDNQDHNTQFPVVEFKFVDGNLDAERTEGSFSKALSELQSLQGEILAAGLADKDFEQSFKDQLKGKIALIDRGAVTFSDKAKRAQEAGAIAVIIVNNVDGDPFPMGGDEKVSIPVVMISKAAGTLVKEKLEAGSVFADLKSKNKMNKPWLTDTISDFSSRGPRSNDGIIKPEIAAPGTNIISALKGGGDKATLMSGTSMAGPHIAGVMALLKQKFKDLSAKDLKAILMNHGKTIHDKDQKTYPVSRQGAGRVQIAASLGAKISTVPAALSFGMTDIEKQKTLSQKITLKNISGETLTLKPKWNGSSGLVLSAQDLTLAPGELQTLTITVQVLASQMKAANDELDGFLEFSTDKEVVAKLPALVVARQISQIKATSLKVHSTSLADSAGSDAELRIENLSINKGGAYLFNALGTDSRKKESQPDISHNRNCDMQSAGYRIVDKNGGRFLQVAVKLFEKTTTWNTCELNVQIDSNKDNKADQEIAGVPMGRLRGLSGAQFVSILLDSNKARESRKKYESDLAANPTQAKEDYSQAVLDSREMKTFDLSTLAIVEADVSRLSLANTGELNIKISTTHQDFGVIEYDDYLDKQDTEWQKISVQPLAQSYVQLPEVIELMGQETKTLSFQKGYGTGDLIMYSPQNRGVMDVLLEDTQSQVIPAVFDN